MGYMVQVNKNKRNAVIKMMLTQNEIIEAMQSKSLVLCWHNSPIHGGKDCSAVLIIRRRLDGWVLVKFDDGTRLWVRESELEVIN